MSYRAVIFDLFDTLIYITETGTRKRVLELLEEEGLAREHWLQGWRSTFEQSILGQFSSMEQQVSCSLQIAGMTKPNAQLIKEVAELFKARHTYHLYTDVRPAFDALRHRGFSLGLISNLGFDECDVLDLLGLQQLFDAVVLSCKEALMKPDQAIFLMTTKRISTTPDECVFVDDRLDYLAGAMELGMTGVQITRPGSLQHGPLDGKRDLCIQNLQELLDWLPARAGEPMWKST
jgi:HAD superfamily hydrolase (TIGR01509 family)